VFQFYKVFHPLVTCFYYGFCG